MADGDRQVFPQDPENPYKLGRHQWHDPRNRQFRALAAPPPGVKARLRPWHTSDVYDQGSTSACTAYSAVGVCRTQPHNRPFNRRHGWFYDTDPERVDLYYAAQKVDPWPGSEHEDPRYEGSSTDAPFKVLRDRGHVHGWRWLFGEGELREYVSHHGPASVGTVWKANMFNPRADGTLDCSGEVRGGHAYRVVFFNTKAGRYMIVNSWGRGWGRGGRAWIAHEDMAALLADGGEAVVIG